MSEIIKSAIVPFSSNQMIELVNSVEKYPEFLRWCQHGYIEEQFSNGYVAGMVIRLKGIQVEFSTRNELVSLDELTTVDMSLVKGPFKKLSGQWRFLQFPSLGSKVELQLLYEVKSQVLGKMFAKGFDQLASRMVGDFVKRAGEVYATN